jgi:hypothetical protein
MTEHFGGREPQVADEAQFPAPIRVAGLLSRIFAGLLLLNAGVSSLLTCAMFAWIGPPAGGFIMPLGFLTGLACFIGGGKIMRGKAQNTSGHGISAIICGLLNLGFGTLLVAVLLAADAKDLLFSFGGLFYYSGRAQSRNWALFIGGVSIVAGMGLITGGVLAWSGRRAYQLWRESQLDRCP